MCQQHDWMLNRSQQQADPGSGSENRQWIYPRPPEERGDGKHPTYPRPPVERCGEPQQHGRSSDEGIFKVNVRGKTDHEERSSG